jgi:hypothetical protein
MDGKGAWRDNVFVERLWRSVKYEEVYLRAYEGGDLLGDDPSTALLARNIAERAQGINPFFLEELVHSLVERGDFEGQRGARFRAVGSATDKGRRHQRPWRRLAEDYAQTCKHRRRKDKHS